MNKYLEKIAEQVKEASNTDTILRRLATRGRGAKGTEQEVKSLKAKMQAKAKEHLGKVDVGMGSMFNKEHFDRVQKIDENLSNLDLKQVMRSMNRESGPTAQHRALSDIYGQ